MRSVGVAALCGAVAGAVAVGGVEEDLPGALGVFVEVRRSGGGRKRR